MFFICCGIILMIPEGIHLYSSVNNCLQLRIIIPVQII